MFIEPACAEKTQYQHWAPGWLKGSEMEPHVIDTILPQMQPRKREGKRGPGFGAILTSPLCCKK